MYPSELVRGAGGDWARGRARHRLRGVAGGRGHGGAGDCPGEGTVIVNTSRTFVCPALVESDVSSSYGGE